MLKDELNEVFGEWEGVALDEAQVPDLGSMEDMQELCEMTQLLDHEVSDVMQQVKVRKYLVQVVERTQCNDLYTFESINPLQLTWLFVFLVTIMARTMRLEFTIRIVNFTSLWLYW